ncbi:DUF58 domain-containing protein [Sphingomonas sp. CLY1604]|uniref:DUF58 domain-containing protein n=1 Tax=Sphingomonas sp. CLY1604 TaxID=3457786 RepID=UPI003FD6EE9A
MNAKPTFGELFDPSFLERLGALSLRIGLAQKGGRLADQRTPARGQGSDFADFKPYVAGDDLRAIDWNIYRRLGKTFVRVFEERQDLPVYLLVDASPSMYVETPPRIAAALRTALAIGAVALQQHDSIHLLTFADDLTLHLRNLTGKAAVARLAQALAGTTGGQRSGLAAALRRLAGMRVRHGLVVVISDFFDDEGAAATVAAMGALPHRLLLVQLVRLHDANPALNPDLAGDVTIDDGERQLPLSITPATLERYRALYAEFATTLTGFAHARGAGMVRLDANRDVLDQLVPLLAGGRSL